MHPVRQNIVWHPEESGDVAVVPTVYETAVQQLAVVVGQIPQEGAEAVTSHGSHRRDLSRRDRPSRLSVRIGSHRAAVVPSVPGTSLPVRPLPAPEIPGATSKPKGAPRKY